MGIIGISPAYEHTPDRHVLLFKNLGSMHKLFDTFMPNHATGKNDGRHIIAFWLGGKSGEVHTDTPYDDRLVPPHNFIPEKMLAVISGLKDDPRIRHRQRRTKPCLQSHSKQLCAETIRRESTA